MHCLPIQILLTFRYKDDSARINSISINYEGEFPIPDRSLDSL